MNKIFVNILTPFNYKTFTRQFENNGDIQNFVFFENSNLDLVWDLIIVYEGINTIKCFRCKLGGVIFISGEPPMSRRYSTLFLNQFDQLITSHKFLKHRNNHLIQQSLPWHFGFNYTDNSYNFDVMDLINTKPIEKFKKLSIISSDKKMMPGHHLRYSFINMLKKEYGEKIDFFGKGHNFIDDKSKGLSPYFFSICIENSAINDYWTEKFSDPLLAYCVPVYYGCSNINEYFDVNGFVSFDIKNKTNALATIDNILTNTTKIYYEKLNILIENREKILFKYNITFFLINFYYAHINNINNSVNSVILKPSNLFWDHEFRNIALRSKRLIYKIASL